MVKMKDAIMAMQHMFDFWGIDPAGMYEKDGVVYFTNRHNGWPMMMLVDTIPERKPEEIRKTFCNKCGKLLFRGTDRQRKGMIIYCAECPGTREKPTVTGETVELIASGYEWSCRYCSQLNTCISVPESGKVECTCCRRVYSIDDWVHCQG